MALPKRRPTGRARTIESLDEIRATVQPLRVAHPFHERGVYETVAKPVLDRMAGVLLSLLTLPLVALIVPGIWLTLGTPAIFRQRRVGRLGREFTVFKFRTMREDRRIGEVPFDHTERRRNHKSADDPRHIPYGRFLRKWSLDEIPQLWNIALGEMSLVGPRPELPHMVARYEGWQHRRHEATPGLTGLWQISARGEVPLHEATDIDVEYIASISFWSDFRILVRTPMAVLGSRKGH